MKQAEFNRIRSIAFKDEKIPSPNRHELLLKSLVAGICGSEVHAYLGMHPFRKPPSVLGHEVIAEVVSIGEQVTAFQPGDIVTVEPQFGCNNCQPCTLGKYNLCHNKTVLGTPAWSGAYAEYFTAPESCVYQVPKEIPYEISVLAEPLAVGVHAAKRANISEGENVVILGGGPIGLLTAVASIERGASRVIITDAVDLNLSIAKTLGATDTVNILKNDLASYIMEQNLTIDHVFITVGIPSVVNEALKVIKKDGCITSIALFEELVNIDFNQLMIHEIKFQGSSMYVKSDFKQAIQIISSNKYDLEKLITKRYPFERISEALEDNVINAKETVKTIIMF